METYSIYSRSGERCFLADTDTFTLALSDSHDAETAEKLEETTPEMLADWFDFIALRSLAIERESCEKLDKAILLAAMRKGF